jgi:hypothetical protein
MTLQSIQFDPATHRYTINGRELPHVTGILEDVLAPDYSYANEWHMERGQAVHRAAELIGQGKTLAPVCEAIAGRVEAVKRWHGDHAGVEVLAVERRVWTPHYAGTLDLLARDRKGLFLLDWKCGGHMTTCWQLGAYAYAHESMTGETVKRGRGVTLNDDGTYKETEEYDLRRYATEWRWILAVWQIKQKVKGA